MRTWMLVVGTVLVQSPIAILAQTAAQSPPLGSSEADSKDLPPATDEIAQWIEQLDSDRYLPREEATQKLVAARAAAFGALLEVANGDKPEPADRAIWALQQGAGNDDENIQWQAHTHLAQIKDRPLIVARSLLALAEIQHRRAVTRILAQGAKIMEPGVNEVFGRTRERQIVLDKEWEGGDEGLEDVAAVRNIRVVFIRGADVTPKGIVKLAKMAQLQQLLIYGIKLDDEQVADLKQRLAKIPLVDFRRGALLGITSQQNGAKAVVGSVRANTAAAAAGLLPGDVIEQLDGQEVGNFQHLTSLISKHYAGDEVTLQITRGQETLTQKIQFGSW
jgi:hypothetical protein